jgi:lipoyl synthase
MQDTLPRPAWLKVRLPRTEKYHEVRAILSGLGLNTVCSSAQCPNIFECWDAGACTFMILGHTCTRACRFCAVDHTKAGQPLDNDRALETGYGREDAGSRLRSHNLR